MTNTLSSVKLVARASSWTAAMRTAGQKAAENKRRHFVMRNPNFTKTDQSLPWMVWELGFLSDPDPRCSHCGQPYTSQACGPSHALNSMWFQEPETVS